MNKNAVLTVRVSAEMKEGLRERAQRDGVTMGIVVRWAVQAFLEDGRDEPKGERATQGIDKEI